MIFYGEDGFFLYWKLIKSVHMRRLNFIFAIFFLFGSLFQVLHAQTAAKDYGVWGNFTKGRVDHIFSNTAIIRAAPDTRSVRMDTLYVGDSIRVQSREANDLELKGILAPWFRISYTKNGVRKQGYVWSGLVALKRMVLPDVFFLVSVDRVSRRTRAVDGVLETENVHDFLVKAVREGKVIDRSLLSFTDIGYESINGGSVPVVIGLKNVIGRFSFELVPEVHEMSTISCAFLWTGNKMTALPLTESAHADDDLFIRESLVLPGVKGMVDNTVIWRQENSEHTDKIDKKGMPVAKVTRKEKKYLWDGEKLTPAR